MATKFHNFLKNLSVRSKLFSALLALLITIIAISNLAFITATYWITQQATAPQGLKTLGGLYSTPVLSRQILNSSDEAYSALSEMVDYFPLKGAAIYGRDGTLLATFLNTNELIFPQKKDQLDAWLQTQFGSHYKTDLDIGSDHPGHLVLLATNKLPTIFYIGIISASLGILILSILLWLILARQIKRHITLPIYELENLALRVTREENYALRVIPHNKDEIGRLTTNFNTMLSRIEAREQQLKTARDEAQKLAQEMRHTNEQLIKEAQERSKVEKKLIGFQHYLDNIINSMPSALIAVDKELYITQWNQEATQISGSEPSDAINQPIALAFPHIKPFIEPLKRCVENHRIEKVERVSWMFHDQIHYYSLTFYPLTGSDVTGGVIRVDDITERLNLHEMMVQSEKMLSVGGLAAGMAHEINNPLGAILHNVQNIRRRLSSTLVKNKLIAEQNDLSLDKIDAYLKVREIPQLLDGIYQAGTRASKIVTHMLSFSRRSNRTFTITSLPKVIKQTLEIAENDLHLGEKLGMPPSHIHVDFSPHLPEVPIIINEIEQVLLNLLKNAAQAISMRSPDPANEPGTIQIRLFKQSPWLVIEIEDNGIGMSEHTAKRIFEPFFTTKDVNKGTGLGLFVSYFIITNNHKGQLLVRSIQKKGTCFTIRLPIKQ